MLWPVFREIAAFFGEGDKDALVAVEKIAMEFAKIDPGSFTFRYPQDRKGNQIAIDMESIDLEQLRGVMAGVGNFFECVELEFDSRDRNY